MYISRHLTLARLIRSNKLPTAPHLARSSAGLREMEDRDIGQIGDLFTRYMQRFGMAPLMTLDEIRHQSLVERARVNACRAHGRDDVMDKLSGLMS